MVHRRPASGRLQTIGIRQGDFARITAERPLLEDGKPVLKKGKSFGTKQVLRGRFFRIFDPIFALDMKNHPKYKPWGVRMDAGCAGRLRGERQNRALPKSIPEQLAIAAYLDRKTAQIDTAISGIRQEIALLQEYRQALIFEVVTGKIDVQD